MDTMKTKTMQTKWGGKNKKKEKKMKERILPGDTYDTKINKQLGSSRRQTLNGSIKKNNCLESDNA